MLVHGSLSTVNRAPLSLQVVLTVAHVSCTGLHRARVWVPKDLPAAELAEPFPRARLGSGGGLISEGSQAPKPPPFSFYQPFCWSVASRLVWRCWISADSVLALVVGGDGHIHVLQGRVGISQSNDLGHPCNKPGQNL